MKDNRLTIRINKPVSEVFAFTITPPNSTLWINSVISEETNEWPVKKGTIYKLQNRKGDYFEVKVVDIKENDTIEWVSQNNIYHCRYRYKFIDENTCEIEYYEWSDEGDIEEPFTIDVLMKLKSVLESEIKKG